MIAVLLCAWGSGARAAPPEPLQIDELAPSWSVEADETPPPEEAWWAGFKDPSLSAAVERGLQANPDLDAARGRAQSATGARFVALSGLLPGLNFTVNTNGQPANVVFRCAVGPISPEEFAAFQGPAGTRTGTGTATGTGTDGGGDSETSGLCWTGSALLNLNWNVDLFGRSVLGHTAAVYEQRAANGDVDATRLLVSSSVVNTYLDVVSANLQVSILEGQLESQQALLEVLELRYEQGGAAALDVLQQRQTVANTEAALPAARASARSQVRGLGTLLGLGPQDALELLTLSAQLPDPTATPSVGRPKDLADRRPELRSAELRMAAAKARHQSAVRGLLPTVSLNANAGWQYAVSTELSSISQWGLGGSVTVPIFNGGATQGAIQQAAGNRVASVRAFDTALLGAIRDVENALVLEQEQKLRHEAVQKQVEAARQAFGEAQNRYLTGIDNFLNVLAAQGSLQAAELSLVQAHRDRLGARVQLWTALGGSTATGDVP